MARKKSKNRRRSNKPSRGTGTDPRQPSPPSTASNLAPNLATAGDTGATLTAATPTPTPLGSNPGRPMSTSPPSTTPTLATAGETGATLTAATTTPTPRIGSNGRPMTYVSNTVSGACAPFSLSAAEAIEKNPLPWVVAYRKGDFDYVVSHESMLLKMAKEAKQTHFVLMHLYTIGRCHLMSYLHYKKKI